MTIPKCFMVSPTFSYRWRIISCRAVSVFSTCRLWCFLSHSCLLRLFYHSLALHLFTSPPRAGRPIICRPSFFVFQYCLFYCFLFCFFVNCPRIYFPPASPLFPRLNMLSSLNLSMSRENCSVSFSSFSVIFPDSAILFRGRDTPTWFRQAISFGIDLYFS